MTKLTAKKGMIKYKVGHGKEDFDFSYLSDLPFDKNGEQLTKVLDTIKQDLRDELLQKTAKLEEENKMIRDDLAKLRKAFEDTLKGLMTR